MVDIFEISAVVAAVGVLIGVVYYILDIRHQAKTRQTDLVMQLYSELGSKEFLEAERKFFDWDFKDHKDFMDKYKTVTSGVSEVGVSFGLYCYFYQKVGILLHRKLIDIELVDDLFSINIKGWWEKVKPIAEGIRKEYNMPQYLEWFEYLYDEVKKREQRK
jgi:hypothetical protein